MTASGSDDCASDKPCVVTQLAAEIERYLASHPHAADSVDGILRWWLRRQRYEESKTKIQQALELLVERGAVSKRVLAGQVVYASGNDKKQH